MQLVKSGYGLNIIDHHLEEYPLRYAVPLLKQGIERRLWHFGNVGALLRGLGGE